MKKDIKKDLLYKEIGINIEKLRREKFTQEEFAKKCGLSRTSIVHIEHGRQKISIDRLYRIAESLQVQVFELLPSSRPKNTIDPISSQNISEKAKQQVESVLKKHKGEV